MIITITLLIASILLLALFYTIITITRSSNSSIKLPPGSFGWPLLGETLDLLGASRGGIPEAFMQERMNKYNSKVFKTSLLGEPMVAFCGTAGHKFLYQNENKLVNLWWPKSTHMLLGSSLIVLVGDEANRVRRMLMTFLGPKSMFRYMKTMDMVSQYHIKTLWEGKEEVKVYPAVKLYTLELTCRLFMGMDDPEDISNLAELFHVFLKGMIAIPVNFPGTKLYDSIKAGRAIRNKLHIMARQRKLELEQKRSSSEDLLSYLLATADENGKFLNEEEIVSNILLLLFAGHDTTNSAITLIIKYLAELPEIYANVLKEQMDIASSKPEGEFLEWEDLQKMKYTWNVVCEAMRLSPPVIVGFRKAIVDFTYEGYTIPKGWKIYWSCTSTTRDPSLFPNEAKFDASRFEGVGPALYSFVPFGGGPRMCIGQDFARPQILVFLHNVVKRFKWKLLDPDEKIVYDALPLPAKGLPIRLQPHNSVS